MAVKLVNALTTRLGRHIPISSFMGAPTIAELAVALSPEGASDDAGSIVTLQRAATGTPLFLIHAIGGHLLGYRDLVQALGHAGPVYGIQRPEIAAREAPRFLSIADLAEQYLEQILRIQQHGDYLLCGWSFGGIVALRIAERLEAMGKQVRYVGLIDCVLPLAEVDRLRPVGLERWAGREVQESLPEMPLDVAALAEQVVILNDVDNVARQSDSVDHFFRDLYLANFWAMCTYTPSVRVPNVRIYCASESKNRSGFDASLAYLLDVNAVARAEFFAGDPYSILKAPRALALAKVIGADITADQAGARGPAGAMPALHALGQPETTTE
jgi:thioesterase domain-containing protein